MSTWGHGSRWKVAQLLQILEKKKVMIRRLVFVGSTLKLWMVWFECLDISISEQRILTSRVVAWEGPQIINNKLWLGNGFVVGRLIFKLVICWGFNFTSSLNPFMLYGPLPSFEVPSRHLLTHIVMVPYDFRSICMLSPDFHLGIFYLACCHNFKVEKVCNYLKIKVCNPFIWRGCGVVGCAWHQALAWNKVGIN